MLGYEEHEYIGHHIAKFHKSKDCITDILARLSKREVLKNHEAEMICKDGSPKFVSINSSVLWQGSKFIHTRCFTIDISAQKIATEAVRESEQRFKIIAELVPLILWTSDENGMFTFLNSRWRELTGKEIPESVGNQWLNAIHPEDQSNIRDSWNKSLQHRSAFEAKFRILNDKGGHTVCYVNSIPRFDLNHNFIGYVGTMQDFSNQEHITASLERMVLERTNDLRIKNSELSKAERALKIQNAELEKINSELSAFAHVASHDLQEPLRKIQTFTDRVIHAEGQQLTETAVGYIKKIQNASSRMRALIHDILLYSKANNSRTEKEEVDLNDVVSDVILEFEVKIEEQNALVECVGVLPTVYVRRFQFHQLFLNLVSNALKFTKPGVQPHIRIISTVAPGGEVRDLNEGEDYYKITMSDNGIGFDGKHAESIFEMFNRLHGRTEYEGTGIGLAICKKIVESYGGKLLAEGVPGTGATFHMYLPQKKE
jgi:PAS domain S-box-containing protein